MRTGITQKVPTGSPFVQVVVDGDTHTSEGGSGNDLLMKVTTDEQVWGGQYIIELDNSNETLNAEDYKGKPLVLKWGYVGETPSQVHPLWVWSQQTISRAGKLLIQLNCVDIWAFIAAYYATIASASYNSWWQQEAQLETRTMADGESLLSDQEPTLYATLLANGNKTILAILQDLLDTDAVNVTLDTDDYAEDDYISVLKPPIDISNARSGLRQLMDYTQSYLKWKTNGHLGIFKPAYHATVYTFNHLNTFYTEVDEAGVTIPNRIIFWSYDDDGDQWIHSDYGSGYGVDSDSYSRIGRYVDRHYLISELDTNNMRSQSDLNESADGVLEKIQGERNQGFIVAPMHCSLELFDKVQVNDDRYTQDRVVTGYVHRIVREYDRGVYRITVYLGGTTSGYTPPGGDESKGLAEAEPPSVPNITGIPPWADILPKAIQGYMHDIVFSSTDWDTVAWTSGTIKFYDESTQAINSGNTGNLATDAIYYIYFDLDDASPNVLKVTTAADYQANHINEYTSVLCVVQRRSGATATFLPGWEKQPLIVTDMIYMPGLVEYDYGGGQKLQTILDTQISAGKIYVSSSTSFAGDYDPTDKFDLNDDDLDDIDDGGTYEKVRATSIYDGYIELNTYTKVAGNAEWYDEHGVILDSGKGIRIYGTDMAFGTFANVTDARNGTNWKCKMDSAGAILAASGDIVMDDDGISVIDEALLFYYSSLSNLRGVVKGTSTNFLVSAGGSIDLKLNSGGGDVDIFANNEMTLTAGDNIILSGDEIHLGVGSNTQPVTSKDAMFFKFPELNSNPGYPATGFEHGAMVYNYTSGYLNCYDTVFGGWWHFDRTSGWA